MTRPILPTPYANRFLVDFLRRHTPPDWTLLEWLKTVYRPYIAPLDDLLRAIPEGARVFDIGCGNGALLALVAGHRQPIAIGGVDIAPGLVDRARLLLAHVARDLATELSVYDGLTLPESFAAFDTVLLVDVLHHVPESRQAAFLAMIHERMAPGATLILKDMDADARFWVQFNRIHDRLLAGEAGHEPSAVALSEQLQQLGFVVSPAEHRRMLVYGHFTLHCRKPGP
jgi:2-polyprenyl-3-methyl-5-hydroxy-6-metoxy-1,4-benzoquinol methylase